MSNDYISGPPPASPPPAGPPAPPPAGIPAPQPAGQAPAAPAGPRSNTLGLIALILAGVAIIVAVIPATTGLTWIVAIAAIVLAIIALVKKGQPRWFGIVAIIVAPLAWILSIIVVSVLLVAGISQGVSDALDETDSTSAPAEEEPADDAAPAVEEAGLGETVTNADGVSVTFNAVTCGIAEAGPEFFVETANGQFCEVTYSVQNGGDEAITLLSTDVKGEIGGAEYEANSTLSRFGEDLISTQINPGLGTDAVAYIDIPVDQALEYVTFTPSFDLFGETIRVRAS